MRTLPSAVRTALATTLTAVGLTASLPAQTASASDIESLREQIRLLDQKLRVLERNSELKEETAVAAAKKQPVVAIGDKGFTVSSPDKAFSVKLGALAQFDARFFFDDEGVPNRDSFFLRRIRTPFTGTIGGIYDFNITPELGANAISSTSSTVGLIDAWFSARLTPGFGLKAGRFISPVALEPGANRHFIESPFVNTLLPNRDIGIEAFGTVAGGFVDYRAGVFNGTRNNTQAFSSDEADGDKTVAGRLTYTPLKKQEGALSKLALGLGGSVGNQRGVRTIGGATGLQNIVTNGQQTLLSFRNATTGNGVIADGGQVRVSPSIEWYTGTPWSFVAEYAYEKQDYARQTGAVETSSFAGTNTAWRATVGYVLTGEEATKSGVAPAAPFSLDGGTWGAFELVGRVSGIDLDDKFFTTATGGDGGNINRRNNASGAFAYGAGVNWYLNRNIRFLFDVEKTEFEGGGGATATGGTKDDELYLFTRLQLQF
ncbi:MAG TPA: porin [Rariglobus sp.]